MKNNESPSNIRRNSQSPRSSNWHYYVIATICCVMIAAGFFFAARQHFSSMEFSLQNSRLRQQLDELQSEKRRLLVSREVTLTPGELRKAVRRIGFLDSPTGPTLPDTMQNPTDRNSVIKSVNDSKTAETKAGTKVVRTAISAPVNQPPAGSGREERREAVAAKKDRT
jgi:hypothetical protein